MSDTLASKWQDVIMKESQYQDDAFNIVCAAFGVKEDDFDNYPCDDIFTDYYDNSIELTGCREGIVVTREVVDKILAMGFYQMWFNWNDNTEIYASATHLTERKVKAGMTKMETHPI